MPRPSNLADLFAQLWRRLAADVASFDMALNEQARRRDEVLESAAHLDEVLTTHSLKAIPILNAWLEGIGAAVSLSEMDRVILVAQAIDRWHAAIIPTAESLRRSRDVALARASNTLLKFGRFNIDDSFGYVLPKRPRWGRWSDPDLELPDADLSVWDSFKSLIVTPSDISASDPDDPARQRTVRFSYRMLDPLSLRAVTPDWIPVVGFAPIAEAPDDIDFQLLEEGKKRWYDARARNLGARAATAIDALCRAGAHIIVFPEMTIHPDALAQIRDAIMTHGPSSELRMVVAGTSRQPHPGARPVNEAVLFNHRGTEIGRQQKLHRWNLSYDLCKRYGFNVNVLHDESDLFEFITPGDEVLVIEQVLFGRICVMICEDLSRSEPGQWLREHMLLDWLFTPILDASMNSNRWMAQKGSAASLGGRCRVIVANSFPLTHKQNEENRKTGKFATLDVCGVAICIDVEGGAARCRLENQTLTGATDLTFTVRWEPSNWPLMT